MKLDNIKLQLFADEGVMDTDESVQPETPEVSNDGVEENQQSTEPAESPVEPEKTDNSIEIEGIGKVSVDDIKEWKQGYLRQSDYTRKTQALATQRQEYEDAINLYNYLKANPDLAMRLQDDTYEGNAQTQQVTEKFNPLYQRLETLEQQLVNQQLDKEISELKAKYPDFNEVEVLNEASNRGITDLEFVYKAISNKGVDDVKKQMENEIRQQILKELQDNNTATQTIISGSDKPPVKNYNLSPQEASVANNYIQQGVFKDIEEYVKWRDNN
jgi:hypothetical protein